MPAFAASRTEPSPAWPRPRTAPDPARLARPLPAPARLAKPLAALGLATDGDALETLPFRFDDMTRRVAVADLEDGEEGTVMVRVLSASARSSQRNRRLRVITVTGEDHTGRCRLVWFNQEYLVRALSPGTIVVARGIASVDGTYGPSMRVGSHEIIASAEEVAADPSLLEDAGGLVPVYHASSRVSTQVLRALIAGALERSLDAVLDPLPPRLLVDRRLPLRRDALAAGHRPRERADHERARHRLAYEELLLLQVALLAHRATVDARGGAEPLPADGPLVRAFRAALPFALTGAQERALAAIAGDLARPQPMQRLLQGDVGSGKTAVALGTLLAALDAGGQGALMAPTEVLAAQHLRTADALLADLPVEVVYLSGDVPAKERRARAARIEAGEPVLAIGTHALLHVTFPRLLAAVVDEQHRFGVEQRAALLDGRDGGPVPHVLHMTATPIPRSLALTAFGDLDVSELDELPAGRKPVRTWIVPEAKRDDCYAWIVEEVREGRQAYVVCPLVEGSDVVEARAAEDEAAFLAAGPLADVRVAVVHGQQRAADRGVVMRAFAAREVDVLVATTVIEVGVDVPNASIMVIEDADRFGLAQLHQLRGRVGRGSAQSSCVLFESAEPTLDGRARLEALRDHASGFELAEIDLAMRGEGHLLGTAQSGRSELRFARLHRDRKLLERARGDAAALVRAGVDPVLAAAADERFGELIAGLRRA